FLISEIILIGILALTRLPLLPQKSWKWKTQPNKLANSIDLHWGFGQRHKCTHKPKVASRRLDHCRIVTLAHLILGNPCFSIASRVARHIVTRERGTLHRGRGVRGRLLTIRSQRWR